jgi:redox-sensitive bicupin YhaK (pirin superfamily)
MERPRKVRNVSASVPTMEGAGVRLRRAFGFGATSLTDPFLLLDDFRGDNPRDYIKGFPWHPHRGIETITYILEGTVEHGDSMGNAGTIGAGDAQWMTAGSGIIHQEMPKPGPAGRMGGFQLWANLPASSKMMDPRYRDITRVDIPVVEGPDGVLTRVLCGEVRGTRGPVRDVVIEPEYLDISMPAGTRLVHPTVEGHTVLAYVFEGAARFGGVEGARVESEHLVLLEDGDHLAVITESDAAARFLLVSGRPLREPVAWQGPIVMNTREELEIAFDEYRKGTFIRKNGAHPPSAQ